LDDLAGGDASTATPSGSTVAIEARDGDPEGSAQAATPPPAELDVVRDPVEDAFSVGMPKGWQNRAYSARVFDIHSAVMTTLSPDGSVLVYSGDPSIPQYWSPAHATPVHRNMTRFNPRMKIEPFVPAT